MGLYPQTRLPIIVEAIILLRRFRWVSAAPSHVSEPRPVLANVSRDRACAGQRKPATSSPTRMSTAVTAKIGIFRPGTS